MFGGFAFGGGAEIVGSRTGIRGVCKCVSHDGKNLRSNILA
jgi:hypothetical protein